MKNSRTKALCVNHVLLLQVSGYKSDVIFMRNEVVRELKFSEVPSYYYIMKHNKSDWPETVRNFM